MTKLVLNKFLKAQISSFMATIMDFGLTIILKESCNLGYLFSTSVGSIIGGITNFELGRRWVFMATNSPKRFHAGRYLLVWGGSILLNITFVYFLTGIGHLNYLLSKILTTLFVAIFYNYFLQKKFVFKINHEIRKTTIL
jgi:putative flippase GtrA